MEASTYGSILKAINVPINTIPPFEEVAKRHGTSRDTVWSIYSQQMQAKVMSRNHEVQAEASLLADILMQGKEDLPSICRRLDLPPCFVARRILEEIPLQFKGVKSKIITEIMRDPKILTTADEETSLLALENDLAKNTDYSGHSKEGFLFKLEKDIRWCIEHDAVYSPASDVARRESGELYEKKLYDALSEACIAFSSESVLRQQGFMKTPDALLTVPIAVQNHIVCWIDSKATFGDIRTHEKQMQEQYQSYINRFGPGLVIYWHSYLASLVSDNDPEDAKVLIMSRFPGQEEIIQLPRLSLSPEASENGIF